MAISSATTPRSSRRQCSTWRHPHPEGTSMPTAHPPRIAVLLAAGKGTRMRSALPKVLHEAAGRPLLAWVVDAARAAGCARILIVVGHGAERAKGPFPGANAGGGLTAGKAAPAHAPARPGPPFV